MSDIPNPRAVIGEDGRGVLIGHPGQPAVSVKLRGDALHIELLDGRNPIGEGLLLRQKDGTFRGECTEYAGRWRVFGTAQRLEFRE